MISNLNISQAEIIRSGKCGVCDSTSLQDVWALPGLPLTETFGPFDSTFPSFDQGLNICQSCGHFQLVNQISPNFLYSLESYKYKSSGAKRQVEETVFLEFINRNLSVAPSTILEFGSNDLSLAKKMTATGAVLYAVDPVAGTEESDEGIITHRMLVEDFLESCETKFDLIVARHTLEHISSPRTLLDSLIRRLTPNGLIVFEFPDLDAIVRALRGDAFFHQHLHYFDVHSARRLAIELGIGFIAAQRNPKGSNGGSLMVAFSNSGAEEITANLEFFGDSLVAYESDQPSERLSVFERFKRSFTSQMDILSASIDLNSPTYGLGAGLMTPILDYHLGGLSNRLECLLDDDTTKHGWSYTNLDLQIFNPNRVNLPKDFHVLLTSLENLQALFPRAISLGPGKILGISVS